MAKMQAQFILMEGSRPKSGVEFLHMCRAKFLPSNFVKVVNRTNYIQLKQEGGLVIFHGNWKQMAGKKKERKKKRPGLSFSNAHL